MRTVSETETTHTIEGLGIPFGGPYAGNSDDWGTRATARTNFYWGLFPDRTPTDAPDVPARFVRPITYRHGLDKDVGLERMGGWSPVRQDKTGVWVQAQLDKRSAWYAGVRKLLEADALSFSSASVEHNARISAKGDWLDWPVFELAILPDASNPWAAITARVSAFEEQVARFRVKKGPPEGGIDRDDIPDEDFAGPDKTFPIVTPSSVADAGNLIGKADDPDAVKAKIIEIAKRKGPDFVAKLPDAWKDAVKMSALRCASCDVQNATTIQGQLALLMGTEQGEDDQVAMLKAAFDAVGQFIVAEAEEIGQDDDATDGAGFAWSASHLAHRIGKRNNADDQAAIDSMHDLTVKLGATAHLDDVPSNDVSLQAPGPEPSDAQPPLDRSAKPFRPETAALPDRIRILGLPGI